MVQSNNVKLLLQTYYNDEKLLTWLFPYYLTWYVLPAFSVLF